MARADDKANATAADYTLRIATGLVELAPEHIVSTTLYNGQFPGPLLRFKEGQRVMVDVHNDTDTPELVHWHGQMIPSDVDGAAEEGSPYVPAHGMRRLEFVPKPAGFRFYHTHVAAGSDLNRGTYTGQVGPVYIEPKNDPGAYDREVFLVLKEFEPSFSRGGDMAMDFLAGAPINELQQMGKAADEEAQEKAKGFEVGYELFSINGRMLGQRRAGPRQAGRARAVPRAERAAPAKSAAWRCLATSFAIVALDGNPVPTPAEVPVLWLGTAERISAIVEMNHPGVWVMGDLADDDRRRGMGIVVEYAGAKGKPQWAKPKPFNWDYARFGKPDAMPAQPDETIEMTIVKHNAALDGFNQWTLNGEAFSMETMKPMVQRSSGASLSAEIPQRQRRHSSAAPSPTQLRAGARRRQADRRNHQGRRDARRLSGGRVRFRRRQSGADALPLPSATAHGFRLHGAVRLRVTHGHRRRRTK